MKAEDKKFLAELAEEMNTQDTNGQADPRYWVIMDSKWALAAEGCGEEYHVCSDCEEYELNDFAEMLIEDYEHDEKREDEIREAFALCNDCCVQQRTRTINRNYKKHKLGRIMRTIKFRGKTRDGEWVYGYYLPSIYEDVDIITVLEDFNLTQKNYAVLKETIGQFVGLTDKNGKEIYEGDIIHVKGISIDKDFGVVTWHKNGSFFVDDSFGEFPRNGLPIGAFFDGIKSNEHFKGMEFYVNGNIHDNKELMN